MKSNLIIGHILTIFFHCLLFTACTTAQIEGNIESIITPSPSPEKISSIEISATATQKQIITPQPTDRPNPTNTPHPNLDVQVFLFSGTAFGYLVVNPFDNIYTTVTLNQFGISEPQPTSANSLAFANHANQIAFWLRNPTETGVLWLGDIEINDIEQIFEGQEHQFTSETSFPPFDVELYWLPNDKYVLFKPTNEQVTPLLINVADLSYQEWAWRCDTIIISPLTSNFALQCSQQENPTKAIMEWDGLIWFEGNKHKNDIIWQAPEDEYLNRDPFGFRMWSPDGSRVAYVDGASLGIANNLGERDKIQFDVDHLYSGTIRWSDDGNRILLSGQNEGSTTPDWFVIDSATLEILWSSEQFDWPEGYLLLYGEISPDGNYVLLSSRNSIVPSGNSIWMYDVNESLQPGTVISTGQGESAFSWGH